MDEIVYCKQHKNFITSSICLTDGCNTMLCSECTQTHRSIHSPNSDQKIMNFKDVLSFCQQTQQLYLDSLQNQMDHINENDFFAEVQAKIKSIKNLKSTLRNVLREYFDKIVQDYQILLNAQQENFISGFKSIKQKLTYEIKKASSLISTMKNSSPAKPMSYLGNSRTPSKSPGLSSKFKLTSSQIQKEFDMEEQEVEDDQSISTIKRSSQEKLKVSYSLVDTVISTLKNQEQIRTQMKQFTNQYLELLQQFQRDKIYVDSDIEDNMKEFLESQFYLIKEGQNQKPLNIIKKTALATNNTPSSAQRSLSPIIMRQEEFQKNQLVPLPENSISSIGISVQEQQQPQLPKQIQQLKQWDQKPLTLEDLETNTHDYFISKPFLHFFNIKDNQIVIQYIGSQFY